MSKSTIMTKREIKRIAKDLISDAVLRIEAGGEEEYPEEMAALDDKNQEAVWEKVWIFLARLDK